MGTVASLTAHRLGIRNDVLSRYSALKDKGVADEVARNTAAAQASEAGQTKPRHRPGVYRRELDEMLSKRIAPRRLGPSAPPPPTPHRDWRLPE